MNPIFGPTILEVLSASDEQVGDDLSLWLHFWSGVPKIFFACVACVGSQQYLLSITERMDPFSDVLQIFVGLENRKNNSGLQLSGVRVEWIKSD